MLSKTRYCIALMRPALASVLSNLHQAKSEQIIQTITTHHQLTHLRQKHESIFDSWSEKPIDHSKVQIDEVLKGFGDRGIKRNGQEVILQDMFKLFQLENKFLINESKLHREMVKLQRALHPDKYLLTDATSRVVSDKLSTIVNQAFETLKNPYKRALYLLGIRAGKSEIEIEKNLDDLKMDSRFLSQMMDTREKIDHDRGGPAEKMKMLMALQTDLDNLILATNRDFENGDYDSVLKTLGYMKFLANCHAALADKLNNFSTY